MKKFLLTLSALFLVFLSIAQPPEGPANAGMNFGKPTTADGAIAADELTSTLGGKTTTEVKVKGKVLEVCKAEGCWIRLQKADGSSMMVRAKDHAFLMPENIVGKTVLVDGSAMVKEVSEEMRKHYAEDAGKSKAEIAKIKGPDKDVQFSARGVKVLD